MLSVLHSGSASGSLRNMPSPEQGTSASTASNCPASRSQSGAVSMEVTTAFVTPQRSRFCISAEARPRTNSLHQSSPLPFCAAAICVDFPPGAAHRSSTRSPGRGASTVTADMADGSCI